MKTKDLLTAIQKVMPAVDGKSIVAQTDHIIFNSQLISAYNGRVSISAEIDTDIDCSVPASDILKIVKSVGEPEVTLTYEDNMLHIESESVRAAVSTEVEEEAALEAIRAFDLDDLYDGKGKAIPEDFIEAMLMCMGAASKNADDMNNLNCLFIDGKCMMAGDGYKATVWEMASEMDTILIPLSSSSAITGFDLKQYIIDGGWMHMIAEDGTVFSVRTGSGDFPPMQKKIDEFEGELSLELPESLIETVKVFGDIAESPVESWKVIEISILGDTIECIVEKNGVSAVKSIPFDGNDVDVSFMISSVMMANIMSHTLRMEIGKGFAMFVGKHFDHLIALVVNKE